MGYEKLKEFFPIKPPDAGGPGRFFDLRTVWVLEKEGPWS